jgi:hypothetical protein
MRGRQVEELAREKGRKLALIDAKQRIGRAFDHCSNVDSANQRKLPGGQYMARNREKEKSTVTSGLSATLLSWPSSYAHHAAVQAQGRRHVGDPITYGTTQYISVEQYFLGVLSFCCQGSLEEPYQTAQTPLTPLQHAKIVFACGAWHDDTFEPISL